jgi:hypothetical protein
MDETKSHDPKGRPMTPNPRPAEGRTSPQETKLAGNGETVADEAVERAAISPGAIEEASGEWVVLDPAGKEVARERSCARAWARVRGTYKTTVEGMAGLEEAGWRVIPLALDEETFVRERLAKLLAETVVVLRGPEPPLTRWGYHDIPQQVAALLAERDALTNKCSDAESEIRALRGEGWRPASEAPPVPGWYWAIEHDKPEPMRWSGTYWNHTRMTRDLAQPRLWHAAPSAPEEGQ